jgi:RNA polymerase sigma-70 factor (ECF subfamily)
MNDAEDLAQNTAAKGWEKRHQFQGQSKLSSWLCCIAHNLYITERRCRQSQWNQRTLSLTDDFGHSHDHPTTSTDPTSPLTSQQIRNSIAVTHPQYLTTLDLALYGLSYPEIAKQLGLAYPAVRSRVHRMHLILREQYKNRAQD